MSTIWPVLTQVIWNNFCRELEVEKKNMNEEINMLEQQLQDEQEASDDKTKRMSKLEKDIRDLRVQLEQKIEIGLWNKFSLEWFDLVCNTQENMILLEKRLYLVYWNRTRKCTCKCDSALFVYICTIIFNLLSLFGSVNDYEDQIQKKTQDMDQQVQLVSDLDSEVKRLQVSLTD